MRVAERAASFLGRAGGGGPPQSTLTKTFPRVLSDASTLVQVYTYALQIVHIQFTFKIQHYNSSNHKPQTSVPVPNGCQSYSNRGSSVGGRSVGDKTRMAHSCATACLVRSALLCSDTVMLLNIPIKQSAEMEATCHTSTNVASQG